MSGCPHGMPTPGSCVECMEEGNIPVPPRPAGPTIVLTFTAKYEGHCRGCNFPISVGQRIVALTDDTYRHADASCLPESARVAG